MADLKGYMDDSVVWDECFSICVKGNIVKFTNRTNKCAVVAVKPVKPKIKWRDSLLVRRQSYLIHDGRMSGDIDLTKIGIHFENDRLGNKEASHD